MAGKESRTALVLGISGGIGHEVAAALLRHGWNVKGLVRSGAKAEHRWSGPDRPSLIAGDAMDRATVTAAAEGASVIFHAVNPPSYANWDRLVLPMIDNTIAAARARGARIVMPGTTYNFDPARTPVIDHSTHEHPRSANGKVRAELERRLRIATDNGARVLIVRAGDFFGPRVTSSWFSKAIVKPGRPIKRIMHPGKPGVGHSWAYLPDLAEAITQLADRDDELPRFEKVQFEGLWDHDGTVLVEAIRRAVDQPSLPVRGFPWPIFRLLGTASGAMKALADVEPFWRYPQRMDNRRLVALLGAEPRTPLDVAMQATLVGLGCQATDPADLSRPQKRVSAAPVPALAVPPKGASHVS